MRVLICGDRNYGVYLGDALKYPVAARKVKAKARKKMLVYMVTLPKNTTIIDGGAKGADEAFKEGAGELKEILRPKDVTKEAIELARSFHPAWHNCNNYVRELHGRNAQIILGKGLITPVKFVISWTIGGKNIGGTKLGMDIAKANGIDVFNVYNIDELKGFEEKYLK